SAGIVVQPLDSLVDDADANWMDARPREPDEARDRARLARGEIGAEPPPIREGPVRTPIRRNSDPDPAGLLGVPDAGEALILAVGRSRIGPLGAERLGTRVHDSHVHAHGVARADRKR